MTPLSASLPLFASISVHSRFLYLLSAKLSFTAEAGRHYELRGRGDEHQVALGIYELSEGKLVSKEFVGTPSLSVAERAPLFIYIP